MSSLFQADLGRLEQALDEPGLTLDESSVLKSRRKSELKRLDAAGGFTNTLMKDANVIRELDNAMTRIRRAVSESISASVKIAILDTCPDTCSECDSPFVKPHPEEMVPNADLCVKCLVSNFYAQRQGCDSSESSAEESEASSPEPVSQEIPETPVRAKRSVSPDLISPRKLPKTHDDCPICGEEKRVESQLCRECIKPDFLV